MTDQPSQEASSPAAPVSARQAAMEKLLLKGLSDAADELLNTLDVDEEEEEVLVDASEAVKPAEQEWTHEWRITTGSQDSEGRAKRILVRVYDPGKQELGIAFLAARDKDAATASLWGAVIVEPKLFSADNPDLEKMLRNNEINTATRADINSRILEMLGMGADFFEKARRTAIRGRRQQRKSASKSPQRSTSPRATSSAGSPPAESLPTPTSTPSGGA